MNNQPLERLAVIAAFVGAAVIALVLLNGGVL